MPSETMQAIVLRRANYRDHDRMLTLFSPRQGKVDALSRGCRRPKSPLLAASEVFTQGEFVLFRTGERYTLTSCAVQDSYYPLRLEPYRLTCASYLLGLCHAAVQPSEAAPQLYALLQGGLHTLAYRPQEEPLPLTTAFLLLYAALIGYRPRLNRCAHCRAPLDSAAGGLLDIQAGGLVCPGCAGPAACRLSPGQVAWMRSVLAQPLEEEPLRQGAALQSHPPLQDGTELFIILRRYVESRLDTLIKGSAMLP